MFKNKKLIIISAIFIIIVVIMVVVSLIPKSNIVFAIAPETVNISIDNNKMSIKNGDTISFKPGEYNYEISRDGFETYSNKIILKNGDTVEMLVALKPLTEDARKLLLNIKSQIIVQRFYGLDYKNTIESYSEEYPLIDELPINARLYMISACNSVKYPNDTSKIAICADITSEKLKPYVIKDIESRGYNIDDYELIFTYNEPTGE